MMEVDIEELGSLLYPDGVPENEEFKKYLIYLASCGLDKVLCEESHLKDEKNSVLEETRNFAYKNYKTFIHSAECSRAIYKQFTNVEKNVDDLIVSLPNLKSKVHDFLNTSKSLSQSRKATLLTLNKHTRLLEILELPQIMETCVRNGYYEDALEILSHVKRIEKKHADIPLILSIVSDVKGGTRLMLLQLLMQLRSSLSLPACLRTVGYLRRLEVFSDSELRVKFLQARDSWLSGMVKVVPKDDAFLHISKIIEIYRVHLFDIVTHYRAIFSDDEVRLNFDDSGINEQSIFNCWIVHKVTQFLDMLEKDLARGVAHNLESLLDQSMFFGQSFSRIGVDFRCLLIPIFQEAILKKFESDVQSANIKFDESLSSFSFVDAVPFQTASLMVESQEKTNPPLSLMEFYPIAWYSNGIITAFNGLRQCCPIALLKSTLTILRSSLTKVVTALIDLHHMESSAFSEEETKSFRRLCEVVHDALIPHFNTCLHYLFPLEAVSKITGKSNMELQKESINSLNVNELTKPIEEFLPKRPTQMFQMNGLIERGTADELPERGKVQETKEHSEEDKKKVKPDVKANSLPIQSEDFEEHHENAGENVTHQGNLVAGEVDICQTSHVGEESVVPVKSESEVSVDQSNLEEPKKSLCMDSVAGELAPQNENSCEN